MKNTISFILPLLIFSHLAQAQEEIKIDSDIPCTFIEDYESKLEFPLDFEFINVEIKWIVSFDSILEESWDPYFDKNRTQKDLLFTTFLRGQAMDMTTGNISSFGNQKFKETFIEDDLIAFNNIENNSVDFISLISGDTLHSVKSNNMVFGFEFFKDSIYAGSYDTEVFIYSLNQQKKVWSSTEIDLGPYHNYYGPEGDNAGMFFYHKYFNYRNDSLFEEIYYVSPVDWEITEIKIDKPVKGFSAVEQNTVYFYGSDNRYYSVNLTGWKVNWCLSGDWRWTFLKKNGKWIAVNHEINVATGKLTRTNNYSWNKTFAEWGDYYVLTAFDGDVDHLFLSMKNYEKYYKIKFVTEQELPCDLDHVVYDGKIRFASTESLDESVAYFNCNGKTHIMGIKLLENTKRKYD